MQTSAAASPTDVSSVEERTPQQGGPAESITRLTGTPHITPPEDVQPAVTAHPAGGQLDIRPAVGTSKLELLPPEIFSQTLDALIRDLRHPGAALTGLASLQSTSRTLHARGQNMTSVQLAGLDELRQVAVFDKIVRLLEKAGHTVTLESAQLIPVGLADEVLRLLQGGKANVAHNVTTMIGRLPELEETQERPMAVWSVVLSETLFSPAAIQEAVEAVRREVESRFWP